jgi:hypothetical protein
MEDNDSLIIFTSKINHGLYKEVIGKERQKIDQFL